MKPHPITLAGRRACLTALGALGASLITGCATRPRNAKTYVLIHGAYHGAWAWEKVKPMLEEQGYRVFAPTLKGLAEREGENGPDVTLNTHIDEVIALLDRENLDDVVLVGHSYAGMVVTGVCDRRPQRIAHVVYLDAFLPESGQRLYDFVQPASRVDQIRRDTIEKGKGYQAFPPSAAAWGVTEPLLSYVNKRMTPHPANTSEQVLVLRQGGPYAVPRRTYIDCMQPAMPPFVPIKARVKNDPRWKYVAVPAGHEVMLTHPKMLIDLLAGLS